jgi:hypothetical protein
LRLESTCLVSQTEYGPERQSAVSTAMLVLDKSDENLIAEAGMTENTLLGTGIGIMIVGVVIIL